MGNPGAGSSCGARRVAQSQLAVTYSDDRLPSTLPFAETERLPFARSQTPITDLEETLAGLRRFRRVWDLSGGTIVDLASFWRILGGYKALYSGGRHGEINAQNG